MKNENQSGHIEIEIAVGQIWKENDPRQERYVLVLEISRPKVSGEYPEVKIVKCDKEGHVISTAQRWATSKRFNGKRSGYSIIGTVD